MVNACRFQIIISSERYFQNLQINSLNLIKFKIIIWLSYFNSPLLMILNLVTFQNRALVGAMKLLTF